jgi:hypothetical protein
MYGSEQTQTNKKRTMAPNTRKKIIGLPESRPDRIAPDSVGSFAEKVPVEESEVFRTTFLDNTNTNTNTKSKSKIIDPEKRPLIVVFLRQNILTNLLRKQSSLSGCSLTTHY